MPPLTADLAARLERRLALAPNATCLVWTGALDKGYGRIKIAGKLYFVHRLVAQADDPANHVDHICGNRACVNPRHLRIVVPADNSRHRAVRNRNNTSGLPGASRDKKRWRAQVSDRGRVRHLGSFDTAEEAHAAYVEWQQAHNPFYGVVFQHDSP